MTSRHILHLLLLTITATVVTQTALTAQTVKDLTPTVFTLAERKLHASITELSGGGDTLRFPRATHMTGEWGTVPVTDWTSGFFAGCLWYMYEYSKDDFYKRAAERWTKKLEPMQYFTDNHDIGFMVYNSVGNAYRLTNDTAYKRVVLQAARTAMKRYNPTVGCIKSWENKRWQYPVIIDNMMNLELLFWAVTQGEDSSLYRAAVSHAEHTMKNHFRADGSTYHVVNYDPATGAVLGRHTAQGYADSSVWSRGQAWAIYGFTMAYRYTHDERFLETARRAARYYIGHLPADHIPYWDFKAPMIPDEPRDASSAAIAACGLLELSTYAHDDSAESKIFFSEAEAILRSLASDAYLSTHSVSHAITLHSVTSRPANLEVDVSLIYADYYLLEALLKYGRTIESR